MFATGLNGVRGKQGGLNVFKITGICCILSPLQQLGMQSNQFKSVPCCTFLHFDPAKPLHGFILSPNRCNTKYPFNTRQLPSANFLSCTYPPVIIQLPHTLIIHYFFLSNSDTFSSNDWTYVWTRCTDACRLCI